MHVFDRSKGREEYNVLCHINIKIPFPNYELATHARGTKPTASRTNSFSNNER